MKTSTTLSGLREWKDKEDKIDQEIILLLDEMTEKENIIEENVVATDQAKAEYQKVMISLEKINLYIDSIKTEP